MGNLCGSLSKSNNFSSPGQVVGTTPAQSRPISKIPPSSTKVQTIGEGSGTGTGGNRSSTDTEARKKAAEAAQARAQLANQSSKHGKLSAQLAELKKQSMSDTLNQVSEENRRARDIDAAKETRTYN